MQYPAFKNMIIEDDQASVQIRIRKRIEWTTYAFMVFAFAFVFFMAYLIGWAEQNNESAQGNFFLIMKIIVYGAGTIMLGGMLFETLKREVVELDRFHLILKQRITGFDVMTDKYEWREVEDLKLAPTPQKGWRKVESISDNWNKNSEFTNDFRKVYPTIAFSCKQKGGSMIGSMLHSFNADESAVEESQMNSDNVQTVTFAVGITPGEAKYVIDLIHKKGFGNL
jgi:hypothetical protein